MEYDIGDNTDFPDYEDMCRIYGVNPYQEQIDYSIWTTKDGTKIPIKEMTTLHIKNTIKMISRNSNIENHFRNLIKELINRNEL